MFLQKLCSDAMNIRRSPAPTPRHRHGDLVIDGSSKVGAELLMKVTQLCSRVRQAGVQQFVG